MKQHHGATPGTHTVGAPWGHTTPKSLHGDPTEEPPPLSPHSSDLSRSRLTQLAPASPPPLRQVLTEEWYRFDDERVTHLPASRFEAELKRSYGGEGGASAYMLLYRAVLPQADGGAATAAAPAAAAGADEPE